MRKPSLVIVTGPPGTGKTTLAHQLAKAIGCPAICRDEIKEGMVHTQPGFQPSMEDALSMRAFDVFFNVLGLLLRAGTSVVAEAAFQDPRWQQGLAPLLSDCSPVVVHCSVAAEEAFARRLRRMREDPVRRAHADQESLKAGPHAFDHYRRLTLPAPSITVDTARGYQPELTDIIKFVQAAV